MIDPAPFSQPFRTVIPNGTNGIAWLASFVDVLCAYFFFSSHSILGKKSFSILFHNRIDLPVFENYLCKDSF